MVELCLVGELRVLCELYLAFFYSCVICVVIEQSLAGQLRVLGELGELY